MEKRVGGDRCRIREGDVVECGKGSRWEKVQVAGREERRCGSIAIGFNNRGGELFIVDIGHKVHKGVRVRKEERGADKGSFTVEIHKGIWEKRVDKLI